jgi:putative addiction module component (TIGR02574 family)
MSRPGAAKVIADALALRDEDRAAVAEEILASLDPTQPDSPEAATAFKAELDRRRTAYQSGDEPGIPWPEVRARLRALLSRG